MLHFAVVKVSTFFLFKQVLQAFELVDVEGLEPDEFFSSDERHLLCCVHPRMSAIYKEKIKYIYSKTHKQKGRVQL